MSGEHERGLNLFHHHKKEEEPQYAEDGSVLVETTEVDYTAVTQDGVTDSRTEIKEHKRHEHIGEAAALAAGAYALYEKHEAKKDPEHAHRHKLEEELAATAAVGAGGYVFHEHHEKKEAKNEAEGEKKHHFF
ncbi:hypothetical protein O6H91_06G145500 [Diphasiastrum complanatum]|uniref:Uncharacterized protein n=1 Tax=Diphasiastrum complanatum TaxID=34168 RepID=A0ACC2DJS8_DIPCM|nr:hypothetical protein O6H91_06G145500 [Diphasiastrum complanatum]